ncbi:MAG: hypothetical protein AMXMBFR6_25750 [Betaproteobacteria bacterium]|jgi:hypothetical protein|nr:hypothetical protein [Rhodocyclaceae bacterium]MCG3187855.1 hypothetical protein [Rhodocyclaceae bacterium]
MLLASARTLEHAARIGALRARSAQLRENLADDLTALEPLCALADRVTAGIERVRAHPEWLAGALVLFVVLRPRRAFRFARRLVLLWGLWHRLRPAVIGAEGGEGHGSVGSTLAWRARGLARRLFSRGSRGDARARARP